MPRPITVIAGVGLLLVSRNTLTVFSDKLSSKESISLFFQNLAVLVLSLYVLRDVLFNDSPGPASEEESKCDPPEAVHSRVMAFIQSHSKAKKHVTLRENLSARWKMSKNVISKIEQFCDYILRDFVRYWYFNVTSDECVLHDIEHTLGNAFGMLLMRGRLGLNPITFGFDKCFQCLVSMLSIHREGKDAATRRLLLSGASAPSEHEASKMFRRAVAEEVRQRKHLHPMFYLPVEWNEKVSGHFTGGDPSKLSEADFFNSQRIKACEAKYYQYLAKHLTKILLVEKEDADCRVVRHLVTEILANCVLYPVFNLFTPLVINQWVSYAICPVVEESDPGAGRSTKNSDHNRQVPSKEPVTMVDFTSPPGFGPDRCWAHFKTGASERDIFPDLCQEAPGTYALICLNDKDLFSLLCVFEDADGAEKGLYHVPFVGYTTDPTGFQICLISSHEYFPLSTAPPPSVELLNGSLFVTLEQLVTALSSIATTGHNFAKKLEHSVEGHDGIIGATEGERLIGRDIDGGISIAKSRAEDDVNSVSFNRSGVGNDDLLGHVELPIDDKELWMEQERLVMLYELQGAVEEFQDALRFCETHRKPGPGFSNWNSGSKKNNERNVINIEGDKTAIRALKRFILCLEDIIFHGFSANVDDIDYPADDTFRIDSVLYEHPGTFPDFLEKKVLPSTGPERDLISSDSANVKKTGFSFKTIVKRAMTTKKTEAEAIIADGMEPPAHYRRLSLRTTAAIEGMLNLLDKRYTFNWFWLEILKNSSVLSTEKNENSLVSSASAKFRRLSNSRKDDPTPVVHRLYNSWMDLFSNNLLLSIQDCQQEVIAADETVLNSSAVDKNCLRVFLYDSLVQGKLVERLSRIIRIASKEIVIDTEKKDGDEYIIPSFYSISALRGKWSPHAFLVNPSDISKLLTSLSPLLNTSVTLPFNGGCNDFSREISESPDDNNGGAGLMSFISSASLLSAFSELSLRGTGDAEGGDADSTAKWRQRDERIVFARRLRSRRQSVDQAWGQRMAVEGTKSGSPDSRRISSLTKKVGSLLTKGGDHLKGDKIEDRSVEQPPDDFYSVGRGSDVNQDEVPLIMVGKVSTPDRSKYIADKSIGGMIPMKALTQDEIRHQELQFKLEMLISGRPSLENLIELKIWMPVGKTFEVTVSRAELEDDPTGLTIGGSSMQQVVVYYLAVVCRNTYPSEECPSTAPAWVIRKRYSDFDELNKQLKLHVSNRVMLHLPLPQKQYINVGGLGSGSSSFVEKRRQRLQDYMDCVLRYLSSCDEVGAQLCERIKFFPLLAKLYTIVS